MDTLYSRYNALEEPSRGMRAALDILAVGGLMALAAQARFLLPFSPVPVTLQTFIALSAGFLVGRHRAAAGIALYCVLGLAGTPLLAVSSGATLGYLAAFVLAPYITTGFRTPVRGMLAASLCIYVLGAAWLCLFLRMSLRDACAVGVLPFLPGDAVKLLAAVKLAEWTRR